MEFVTMLFTGLLDIYLHIVIFVKDFYMLFLGKSYASFATGMTILFFPFAYTSVLMSGSYTLVSKLKNPGIWIYTFVLTIMWLWASKDGNIEMNGPERGNGIISFYIFCFAAYLGTAISSDVAVISRGIEKADEDSEKLKSI